MVEVTFTYDFHPNINEKAYAKIAREATAMMLKAEGFVEFRAHRNLVGSPHVRRTSVWKSLSHWAAFNQREDFQNINTEFRSFVINLEVQIWGASPLVPEVIRP